MSEHKETLTGLTKTVIAQRMVEGGMSAEDAVRKAHEKEAASRFWFGIAAVFVLVTLGVVGVALYVVTKVMLAGGSFPILVAIVFAVAAGIPLLGVVYCAGRASGEYMTTFLDNLFRLRKLGNKESS